MKASDQLIEQVNGLSTAERTDLLSDLPKKLLDPNDQKQLATSSLDATKDGAKVDVITQSAKNLSEGEQQTISNALERPSPKVRDRIWMVVIWAFTILIVGSFLTLTAALFVPGTLAETKDARVQIIVTVFTTAAAFLTGLLAPSPMNTQKDA